VWGALITGKPEDLASEQVIVVAAAIDETYVTPLLVTLRSACQRLSPGWTLEVFVLGYCISEEGRQQLESGLDPFPVRVQWRTVDLSPIRQYWPRIRHDAEVTAYYRMFLGEALPASVDRVLFLDADLLIEEDLTKLWNLPFDRYVLQAVPDAYASKLHIPRLSQIPFSEEIRFAEGTPYFNAGVLLINLCRWRGENVAQRAVSFLWKYGDQLLYRDQDALNCSLAGRWKPLPPAWNFHELLEDTDSWQTGGASSGELREAFLRPSIVHFIGSKPWSRSRRPLRQQRWWAEARRAGVPVVRRPLLVRLRENLFWEPHAWLCGYIRHRHWGRVLQLVLTHPWILITYLFWRLQRRYT
jgi:lipopolysaccharide biosynthesis glycosyltransferase